MQLSQCVSPSGSQCVSPDDSAVAEKADVEKGAVADEAALAYFKSCQPAEGHGNGTKVGRDEELV